MYHANCVQWYPVCNTFKEIYFHFLQCLENRKCNSNDPHKAFLSLNITQLLPASWDSWQPPSSPQQVQCSWSPMLPSGAMLLTHNFIVAFSLEQPHCLLWPWLPQVPASRAAAMTTCIWHKHAGPNFGLST